MRVKENYRINSICFCGLLEFKLSLSFGLKLACALIDSRALSTNLNLLKFFIESR